MICAALQAVDETNRFFSASLVQQVQAARALREQSREGTAAWERSSTLGSQPAVSSEQAGDDSAVLAEMCCSSGPQGEGTAALSFGGNKRALRTSSSPAAQRPGKRTREEQRVKGKAAAETEACRLLAEAHQQQQQVLERMKAETASTPQVQAGAQPEQRRHRACAPPSQSTPDSHAMGGAATGGVTAWPAAVRVPSKVAVTLLRELVSGPPAVIVQVRHADWTQRRAQPLSWQP
jgi:hypothetical protein